MVSKAILLFSAVQAVQAAETVVGVYIFSRHGDRTAKSTPPTNLTNLGFDQVHISGQYYRDRYVAETASSRIQGINNDIVKLSQLSVTAPLDDVLGSSAIGFLQGLYPPVGQLGSQELRNGSSIESPLDGYQIIPVGETATGAGVENAAWLQGATDCANAKISSNSYFDSSEYQGLLSSTEDFYRSLAPMINRTFAPDQISFKNGYTIFDLLNVASIHNSSSQSPWLDPLTNSTLDQLRYLADTHEFALAYNASDDARAIAGQTLAGEVLQALENTINTQGKTKLTIEFGAYASFLSFFGLVGLTKTSADFKGVPDYASSMAFELFTNAEFEPGQFPSEADLKVRFLFSNGTASQDSEPTEPTVFPLFGGSEETLSWNDFQTRMEDIAIHDQQSWCNACGNTTGVCASNVGAESVNTEGGMSKTVAGVIGAMVTLAVILGIQALVMVLGGFRLVSKKRLSGNGNVKDSGSEMAVGRA